MIYLRCATYCWNSIILYSHYHALKTIKNSQDYFASDKINSCENETLSDVYHILLNKDVISKAINEMSTNSAAGPDGMPASLFKHCYIGLTHTCVYIHF